MVPCYGSFFASYSLNYNSETDGGDAEVFNFSKMNNSLSFGASLDSAKKFIIAQNITSHTKSQKKGITDQEMSFTLLELGPQFLWYFTQERRWYISYTYNFLASGSSQISGTKYDVEGSSTMASLGYHLKVNKTFAMGASVKYHNITITSRSSGTTKTEVTDTFNSIYPMLEAVLRF